jgi:DNA-directed RNA polymerase subunit RPC12/RpoP
MIDYTCHTCGKKAVVKEQDVLYSCAECWVKRNTPKKEKQK